MTRKHFEAIASDLLAMRRNTDSMSEIPQTAARLTLNDTIACLCITFKQINPRFDARRFRLACGMVVA